MDNSPADQAADTIQNEGLVSTETQLRVATAAGSLLVFFIGFLTLCGWAATLFILFYCHSALGLGLLLPTIPLTWAFVSTLKATIEVSRGEPRLTSKNAQA